MHDGYHSIFDFYLMWPDVAHIYNNSFSVILDKNIKILDKQIFIFHLS